VVGVDVVVVVPTQVGSVVAISGSVVVHVVVEGVAVSGLGKGVVWCYCT